MNSENSARTAYPISSGSPEPFQVPWEAFVQFALKITVEAYQRMRQDGVARRDWEENTFTACLAENYIRPLAFPFVYVVPHVKIYTPEMKTGETSTKRANEIDIRLFGSWEENYHQIHFVWECKRISGRNLDKENDSLIAEYVTEGIDRFIDGEYAASLDDAGLLGYVLLGEAAQIVRDINRSMQDPHRKRQLSDSDCLVSAAAIGAFNDVYQSHHIRLDNQKPIRLHHLFLTFDFKE
ncbi:hypothetical protein L0337_12335 [candidate division KSB1 bacterium]|nr:hypothetical protein [candidate division KSB1 bacterium]